MKKYVLVSVLVFSFLSFSSLVNAVGPTPTTILSESFGTGENASINSPWQSSSTENLAYKPTSGENSPSNNGGRFARIYKNEWICIEVNANNYSNLKISYEWRGDSQAENSDRGIFEYKKNGTCSDLDFTEINNNDLTNNSWTQVIDQSLSSDLNNSSFVLKFRTISSATDEFFRVDNVIITGVDPIAPILTLPSNITQEAISSSGNAVTFTATATDINPTNPVVTCTPSSGSTFPIGTTNVSCSATDTAGNTANGNFTITIQDTTAPIISLNGSSPVKVQVFGTYTELGAIANDLVDGNLPAVVGGEIVNTSVLGTYVVAYTKTDSSGNIATPINRIVNVVDESAPSTTDNVPAIWQKVNTTITFNCTDNVGCIKVYYTTDGTNPTTSSSFVDISSNWQFIISTDGEYTIKYFGVDGSGNEESIKTASNTLKLDKTTPNTSVSSPTENSYLKGLVNVETNTTDSLSGISKVEFWHATIGTKIGEDITTPYLISWDTTQVSDGDHSVWVVAYDNAGNYTVSDVVPVKVDNEKPVITLEDELEINIYVGMEYPYEDLGYSATDNIDGDITDKVVMDKSEVDNTKIGNYKLYYNVTDTAGNKADEVTRDVNVVGRRRNTGTQNDTTPEPNTTENTTTSNTTENNSEGTNNTQEGNANNTTEGQGTPTNPAPSQTEEPQGEVLGEETFKFTQFMKFGTKGGEVSELQKRLTKEGFFTGPITGYFGLLTKEAVKKYQEANPPLKVDGIVGPKTRAVLNGTN